MFRSVTFSSHTFNEYTDVQENPKENFNHFGAGAVISGDGLQAACISDNAVTLLNAATGQQITRLEKASNGFEYGFGEGMSMDFSGNILAVNNNGFSSGNGQVKLFNPKTGALIDTLSNPRSGFSDGFGRKTSLSADGSRIAIGSPSYRNAAGTSAIGVCHVFSLPSKTLLTTINNPNGAANSWGSAISLSGDGTTLAVGAPEASQGGSTRGRVDIYNASTGTLLRTITSPNSTDRRYFGQSVSLSYDGTLLGIGEPGGEPPFGTGNGNVYLFDVATGSLLRTYSSLISFPLELNFGQSISLSGDGSTLIIGSKSNVMYFYTTRDSTSIRTIPMPDITGNPYNYEGEFAEYVSVSHDGKRIVTGAPQIGVNDWNGVDDYTGRFYIYNFSD